MRSGLTNVKYKIEDKPSGPVLTIRVAYPTERLFETLEAARESAAEAENELPLATLERDPQGNLIQRPEGQMLLRTIAESLNINRHSYDEDFYERYTRSVFGAESQIVSSANHVVYGRRGAGKSMLLLYALHEREQKRGAESVWLDMQVYARRKDHGVITDVLEAILEEIGSKLNAPTEQLSCRDALRAPHLSIADIRALLPEVRRLLGKIGEHGRELFLFLDDFHVVDEELQPVVLDVLYSIARGNRIYLKLSAIETLTRLYDSAGHIGLEVPHDTQVIRLDYNLTIPDRATEHLETILNSQAQFCGLPSIRRLCVSADVIPRLTWVSAGVPRDALYLFSQAMTKASLAGRNRVSVSNVNQAASETLSIKQRDLETDLTRDSGALSRLIEEIREFCVTQERQNAFLVEIGFESDLFEKVRALVDLRLLHVINEGVSVGKAGQKYIALILDYGYYTGIRAAKSVDLFNKQTERVTNKQLRGLPVFRQTAASA